MSEIAFQTIKPTDHKLIQLIAEWYLEEWNIPIETTLSKISNFSFEGIPFQILMKIDNLPVCTGGIYTHVSLLDIEPKFKIYPNWLALIYTHPAYRKQGYGTLLCEKIQHTAQNLGLKEIYLFTHTAESLYEKMGWQGIETLELKGKNIVVMKMEL